MAITDIPCFIKSLQPPFAQPFETLEDLDDILEEINVPTYNRFTHVQFWEMLQGLAKLYIVEKDLQERKTIEQSKERKSRRELNPDQESNEFSENDSINLTDEDEMKESDLLKSTMQKPESRWT
jgi:hypothetical protein